MIKSMIRYVVGFCFTKDRSRVILIKKIHPEWQAGKLNGVGGHIEAGESVHQAMKREFREETGVTIPSLAWDHKFTIINREIGYELNVLYCLSDDAYVVRTMTDEQVELHHVDYILSHSTTSKTRETDKEISKIAYNMDRRTAYAGLQL